MGRFINAANAISLLGLACALLGALLAFEGHAGYALSCLVGAGMCDTFDGVVARRLKRSEEGKVFGQRLDSLVDACAFGVAPAFVLYGLGLRSPAEVALLFVFAACAVWRLAYFDTVGLTASEGGGKTYTGLPVTFVGLALPVAGLAGFHSAEALRWTEVAVAAGLSGLMVSSLPVPKPGARVSAPLGVLGTAVAIAYLVAGARFPAS